MSDTRPIRKQVKMLKQQLADETAQARTQKKTKTKSTAAQAPLEACDPPPIPSLPHRCSVSIEEIPDVDAPRLPYTAKHQPKPTGAKETSDEDEEDPIEISDEEDADAELS
ncbi:hypothetical protein FISHEDRAFT_59989 [Fistulina hepatica ATCC 64428]|uniref:Uncharacterized protein n=1 Tax=Fistulina hepatica ATCC 64428 TaxID=1128425 RepID=A0A0D7A7C6_9AGAR|nr:hypothetical protein FISHEDRAFT_59989 [Fistulina hepatica ATCC 64428]